MDNKNIDVSQLMQMLSKMDKKDLEKGVNQLNSILKTNNGNQLVNQIKNSMNNQKEQQWHD